MQEYDVNSITAQIFTQPSLRNKTVYDYNSLSNVLLQTGYSGIERWDWRQTEHSQYDDHSQAYIPHMDKENGILISLNVEGVKA